MDVGKRMTELRNRAKMSGNLLASKSGVSQSGINRIERGEQFPTTETLERICTALGVSLAEFFAADADEMPPDLLRLLQSAKGLTPEQRESITRMIEAMKDP